MSKVSNEDILHESEEIKNPFNHLLIPRLYEKKNNHDKKAYNTNEFLGNKRTSENGSESKK